MQVFTKATVISTFKYSESDLIVKCFTKDFGLKSYLLKGVLKSRKGKLRPSYFQPLSLIEIQATHRDKNALNFIKEVRTYRHYNSIPSDMQKTSIVMFLSEILKQVILEEETNTSLYTFLEEAFIWLEENRLQANFHLQFLLKLTSYLGFAPDTSTINKPIFNVLEGIFEDIATTTYCFPISENSLFKTLLRSSFEDLHSIKVTRDERSTTLNIILLYYQLHIQGFKTPKSLAVLKEVFDKTRN